MRYLKYLVLLGCISAFFLCSFGSGKSRSFDDSVVSAFKDGNSRKLSSYFFENVEVKLLDKEDVYSKAQAEAVMRQFFDLYKPCEFKIQDFGAKKTSNFAIARLRTKNGNFRVILKIKGVNSTFFLQSLHIEVDDEKNPKQ